MTERQARIAELVAKQRSGKITPEELETLKKLMAEDVAERGSKPPTIEAPLPTKEDYEAGLAKAAADATTRGDTLSPGTKGIVRPAGVAPEGQQWVQVPTGGWALAPIAKPENMKVNPELLKPLGMMADKDGNPVPIPDSANEAINARGEAYVRDQKRFAGHLRDLADQGKLTDASGKPLPMYSREKLESLTPDQLKALIDGNPRLAKDFFGEASEDMKKIGYGVGESSMIKIPETGGSAPAPAKPASAPAPVASAPTPEPEPEIMTVDSSAPMVGASDIPKKELPKPTDGKKKFGDKLKELAGKYGVPLLEIIQAVGYQKGGIDKPTRIEQKYQEKLDQAEKDWVKKLEDEKLTREEETYNKRITEQRTWETQQAELNRIADKEARGEELTSREKIAKMQIEASRGSAKAGGSASTASIIPE